MIKSSTRCQALQRFIWEKESEQSEHCRSDCHHIAAQCPITQAVQEKFPDGFFCSTCGGYQVGIRVVKIENTETKEKGEATFSEEKPSIKAIPIYEGGYLRGIQIADKWHPFAGMPYEHLHACPKCNTGEASKLTKLDLGRDTGCHHALYTAHQKRMAELIAKNQPVEGCIK